MGRRVVEKGQKSIHCHLNVPSKTEELAFQQGLGKTKLVLELNIKLTLKMCPRVCRKPQRGAANSELIQISKGLEIQLRSAAPRSSLRCLDPLRTVLPSSESEQNLERKLLFSCFVYLEQTQRAPVTSKRSLRINPLLGLRPVCSHILAKRLMSPWITMPGHHNYHLPCFVGVKSNMRPIDSINLDVMIIN